MANGVHGISKGSDPEEDRLRQILNWPERKPAKKGGEKKRKLCNLLCPAIVALLPLYRISGKNSSNDRWMLGAIMSHLSEMLISG